jgi:hypothetical protein
MAYTSDQIRSVADIGVKVIDLQLSLGNKTAWESFHHIWATGYTFGAFEALARHHDMDKVETAALITIGFGELLPERDGGS